MPKSQLRQNYEYHSALAHAYDQGDRTAEAAHKEGLRQAIVIASNFLRTPNTCANPKPTLSKQKAAENTLIRSIITAIKAEMNGHIQQDQNEDEIPF